MEGVVAAAGAAVLLLLLWLGANRRHVARRGAAAREWDDERGTRPDLWTSSARCPSCGRSGGVLSDDGDEVWFTCLACSQRHRRRHRA
jgi:hypothetical protein